MAGVVLVVAAVQALLAVMFVVITAVALRYGGAAERAAEAEVVRQGFEVRVLAEHRIQFKESAREALFPFGIAACLAVVAALTVAGWGPARIASWVLAGLALLAGGAVMLSQIFAERFVVAALNKSADPAVRGLDGRAVVRAARDKFPVWLRPLQIFRFLLATFGSVLIIILLATSAASAHFA